MLQHLHLDCWRFSDLPYQSRAHVQDKIGLWVLKAAVDLVPGPGLPVPSSASRSQNIKECFPHGYYHCPWTVNVLLAWAFFKWKTCGLQNKQKLTSVCVFPPQCCFLFMCFLLELHANIISFYEYLFSCKRVTMLARLKELKEMESFEF